MIAVASAVLDLLYPPRCAACREPLPSGDGEPFCTLCAEALEPVPAGCGRCGLPGPHDPCGACQADPPAFAACSAGGLLGGPLADAIHALKYRDRPALARPLGRWLAARVSLSAGAIVPVPLARGRRLARGYDQAALLSRSLAAAGGAVLLPGALVRTRETAPQVGRTREERLRGVRGAFRAAAAVKGREIVLVDDVVTTGATVHACALALRDAGASAVRVVALARAE